MIRVTRSDKQCRFFALSLLLILCCVVVVRCESEYTFVKDNILDFSAYDNLEKESGNKDEWYFGDKRNETGNVSGHKSLVPLDASDFIGFSLAAIGLLIAAGGGIGGGGILVPIYTLVMHFKPKYAIPLANVSVFGGAIANVLLNLNKRHPDADRPLVDWDLILIMEPLTIAGALIGGILNKVLPEWLITILLVIVLSLTAHRALKKGFSLYKKENEQRAQQAEEKERNQGNFVPTEATSSSGDDNVVDPTDIHPDLEMENAEGGSSQIANANKENKANSPLLDETPVSKNSMTQSMSQLLLDESVNNTNAIRLREIIEEERRIPLLKVLAIIVMFSVVVTINILKGGGSKPSPIGIVCGSVWFWVAQGTLMLWIFIVAFFARMYLMKRTKIKEEINYPYIEGDIVWDGRATIVYPVICALAGLCAGMFGIGGGIVKGPLMLAMGVHPLVAAATSATMILFTSLTATTTFVVFGLLQYDYAYVLLPLGFVATLIGQTLMNVLIKKSGRNSYVIFIIGSVVALSAVLMFLQSFLTVKSAHQGHGTANSGICGVGA